MKSHALTKALFAVILASALTACGSVSRQQAGIGAGAALGGVAGSILTDGSTVGTVGGAALGGVIGNEMTKPKK
jgi:osmotically inducible lipoprotein OsmB